MLDILLASVVASLLMLNLIDLKLDLLETRQRNVLHYALQSHSADLQRLLLRDLRMAGHGVAAGSGVARADSTVMVLRGDFLRDGQPHTVRYTVGAAAGAMMTEHPADQLLWRSVDGGPAQAYAFGLVHLRFDYFDAVGLATQDTSRVRQVRYEFTLESPADASAGAPAVFVTGAVTPKNLR